MAAEQSPEKGLDPAATLRQLVEARRFWVTVEGEEGAPDAVAICLLRPRMLDLMSGYRDGSVTVAHVIAQAADWRGVTGATLLGPAIGTSLPCPFTRDLFEEALKDRAPWAVRCVEGLTKRIAEFAEQQARVEGN